MKEKNKLAVIALLLAWLLATILSLQFLNLDLLTAHPLLDKLCPSAHICSYDPPPFDCFYPTCIWAFIEFIPVFLPLLLSIVAIILGLLSLKSEKRIVALLAIGITIPILWFYLLIFWDIIFY